MSELTYYAGQDDPDPNEAVHATLWPLTFNQKCLFGSIGVGFVAFVAGANNIDTVEDRAKVEILEAAESALPARLQTQSIKLEDSLDSSLGADVAFYCSTYDDTVVVDGVEYRILGQFADYLDKTIMFSSELCDNMADYDEARAAGPVGPSNTHGAIVGVLVLAHEITHYEGERHEGLANCNALEISPDVARQFGYPELANADFADIVGSLESPPEYYDAPCFS